MTETFVFRYFEIAFNFVETPPLLSSHYQSSVIIGRTPLHIAVAAGNLQIFELLYYAAREPDPLDSEGQTPLSLASSQNNPEIGKTPP